VLDARLATSPKLGEELDPLLSKSLEEPRACPVECCKQMA